MWILQGETTVGRGSTVELMPVDTANFKALVWYPEYFNGTVAYLAILRYFDDVTVGAESVESEVDSKVSWTNATQWQLRNSDALGRVMVYLPFAGPEALLVRYAKFVP